MLLAPNTDKSTGHTTTWPCTQGPKEDNTTKRNDNRKIRKRGRYINKEVDEKGSKELAQRQKKEYAR